MRIGRMVYAERQRELITLCWDLLAAQPNKERRESLRTEINYWRDEQKAAAEVGHENRVLVCNHRLRQILDRETVRQ